VPDETEDDDALVPLHAPEQTAYADAPPWCCGAWCGACHALRYSGGPADARVYACCVPWASSLRAAPLEEDGGERALRARSVRVRTHVAGDLVGVGLATLVAVAAWYA